MSAARYCLCPGPQFVTTQDNVRVCEHCGERENPIVFAMGQALAGPLAELRDRLAALEARMELQPNPRLVDAAEIARMLGKRREWVYAHKEELGARRLARGGKRPRLGFNPDLVMAKLAVGPGADPPTRRAPEARPLPGSVPLLAVKDRAA